MKKLLLLMLLPFSISAQSLSAPKTDMLSLVVNLTKTFTTSNDTIFVIDEFIVDEELGLIPIKLTFEYQSNSLWSLTTKVASYRTSIKIDGEVSKSDLFLIKFMADGSIAWITDAIGTRIERGPALVEVNYITDNALKTLMINLGTVGQTDGLSESYQPSKLIDYYASNQKTLF